MKITRALAMLFSAALTAQATLVYFEISPPGSDVVVGLSPSNAVPAVTNSTGSGGNVSAGVVLDTDASLLHLAVGYGSAAGFTDLTGPATALSLNGPAATGQVAAVLFDLSTNSFPAVDPARGGVILGTIAYPTNAISNLLAGLNYISISTATNSAGELRGQLIPNLQPTTSNSPPVVTCPADATAECGTSTNLSVQVSDPDGDALTVLWTLNGHAIQTNNLPAGTPPVATNVSFTADLPLGTNSVAVTVTDSATNSVSCSNTVTVVDTTPPAIQRASVQPNTLWPPNHKMVPVTVAARATDTCGPATWRIIGVRSSEPVNGLGDGDTAPDWMITGTNTVSLRAERSGKGSGRVYTISIQAKDASGNLSEPKTLTVTVPKSMGWHW